MPETQDFQLITLANRADYLQLVNSLAKWSAWTGMRFPESGAYIVPGALNPVDIDVEANEGVYIEPNVWTVHSLDA